MTNFRPPDLISAAAPADPGDLAVDLFRLLRSNRDALATRVALIRLARHSLDLQYYIARADHTGTWLAAELLAAADRGVHVRLLLDDRADPAGDANLRALDGHRSVEIRLFNPLRERGNTIARLVGMLRGLRRLNRRMHNKALVTDRNWAIVGGRNLGDEYFGANPELEFLDLDVLATGPVASEVATAFDRYWLSRWAVPVARLIPPSAAAELVRLRQDLHAAFVAAADPAREAAVARVLSSLAPASGLATTQQPPPLRAGRGRLLVDDPRKIAIYRRAVAVPTMVPQVMAALDAAKRQLLVVSPYFVPGHRGTAGLVALARRGVRVTVLTNSLAATDVAAVHAGYRRYRPSLLAGGVELFELAPEAGHTLRRRPRLRVAGASRASLHAKAFLVDEERLFVGSFNFDPRSALLNTEMGLLIDSPSLTRDAATFLARALAADASYRLELDARGSLVWRGAEGTAACRWTREPRAPLLRRLLVRLLALLPIENQL